MPRLSFALALGAAALLPAAAAATTSFSLPGIANTPGLNGTRFESAVTLTNLGQTGGTVEIGLVTPGGVPAPAAVTRALAPGQTLPIPNALRDLFGLDGTFGTLTIRSELPVDGRATTANTQSPAGTYGLGLPASGAGDVLLPGETGHALWVSHGPDTSRGFRTNVNVTFLSADSAVTISVFDETGLFRGSRAVSSPAPAVWQASVADIAASADLPLGRVEIAVARGSAIAYAAVVDNVTGDGIAAAAVRVAPGPADWTLDGVARTSGANGTRWSTDVRLFNPSAAPLAVTLDAVGFAAPVPSLTRTVPARGLLEIADVLGPSGLGLPDGVAGAIRVRAGGPLLVAGRTANVDPSGAPGSFSAYESPVATGAGFLAAGRRAAFVGVVQDAGAAGFRTNVAMLGGPGGAAAALTLRDAAGAVLATGAASLGPGEWRQLPASGWFGGAAVPAASRFEIAVSAGSLDAYASQIDNGTGDPVVFAPAAFPSACGPPAILAFSASATSVAPGAAVTLTLASAGGSSARVTSPAGDLAIAPNGTVTVSPGTTTTYRATVSGACAPDAAASVTVTVSPQTDVALTTEGAYRGTYDESAIAFKGVRYAAPPVGPLRWRLPVGPEPFPGVQAATAAGSTCLQFQDSGAGPLEGTEDCLFLNVWRPAAPAASPAPVLFFIHGGGNVQGSGSEFVYDGAHLASRQGVVVVTLNYRLGALGFLAQPFLDAESPRRVSGNYGILDQIAALGWVRRNAAAFGADPARILIFGESAGAVDVCTLVASPLARGLFASALMQSGGCGQETLAKVEVFGNTIVQAAGCGAAADPGACMRGLPASAVVSAVPGLANVVSSSGQLYGPNVDGWLLRESPMAALTNGTHNHVPFAVGANADETSAYAPTLVSDAQYQAAVVAQFGALLGALVLNRYPASAYPTPTKAYVAVTTDSRFVCPSRRIARAARASQAENVFRYFFTHALDSGAKRTLGAYHGLELPFVFRSLTDVPGFVPSPLELSLADAMGGYWSRIAAAGDPNGAGAPSWPRYEVASDPVIQLDDVVTSGAGVRTANCDFWDAFVAP